MVQNCQSNFTKLSLKLYNIFTDTSFVSVCWRHHGISHHSLSRWGRGGCLTQLPHGCGHYKGFWTQTRQSTGGCVAQSRVGRSRTRLSNGLAEIPGRSAFFSQSQWSESWLVLVWLIMLITRWAESKEWGPQLPMIHLLGFLSAGNGGSSWR